MNDVGAGLTLVVLTSVLALAGCGGEVNLTCDDVQRYQLAAGGKRIEAPEDLNDLDPLRELPLPSAAPRPPRPEGSPCLDLPPTILSGDDS